jgi:hypothetical protein
MPHGGISDFNPHETRLFSKAGSDAFGLVHLAEPIEKMAFGYVGLIGRGLMSGAKSLFQKAPSMLRRPPLGRMAAQGVAGGFAGGMADAPGTMNREGMFSFNPFTAAAGAAGGAIGGKPGRMINRAIQRSEVGSIGGGIAGGLMGHETAGARLGGLAGAGWGAGQAGARLRGAGFGNAWRNVAAGPRGIGQGIMAPFTVPFNAAKGYITGNPAASLMGRTAPGLAGQIQRGGRVVGMGLAGVGGTAAGVSAFGNYAQGRAQQGVQQGLQQAGLTDPSGKISLMHALGLSNGKDGIVDTLGGWAHPLLEAGGYDVRNMSNAQKALAGGLAIGAPALALSGHPWLGAAAGAGALATGGGPSFGMARPEYARDPVAAMQHLTGRPSDENAFYSDWAKFHQQPEMPNAKAMQLWQQQPDELRKQFLSQFAMDKPSWNKAQPGLMQPPAQQSVAQK